MIGRFTLFTSETLLAKQWQLAASGTPQKSSAAQMTRGTYEVPEFGSASELAEKLNLATTYQAVSASLSHDGSELGQIVTQAKLSQYPGAKARTKSSFGLQPNHGLLFLDSDALSTELGLSREGLLESITTFISALKSSMVVWRPSGSSHVCHGDIDLTGLCGQHVFIGIEDASDGPRVTKVLADRFWLAGLGRVEVSSSGSLLLRCPIDTSPSDAARLIFGRAECVPPLEQRHGGAEVIFDGGFLDTRKHVPDLTSEERGKLEGIIAQAKAAAMPDALRRRAEHRASTVVRRLPEFMKQGMTAGEAEQRIGLAVDAAYGGTLLSDFELTAVRDDGSREIVTVGEVLQNRDKWDGGEFLDPLHPGHRGFSPDARAFLHSASPVIFSLNDGGQVYRLRGAIQSLTASRGNRGQLVSELAAIISNLDNVFATDTGPVIIEGDRRLSLTSERLMNLIGTAVVLNTQTAKGASPMDLSRETAGLVLTALNT